MLISPSRVPRQKQRHRLLRGDPGSGRFTVPGKGAGFEFAGGEGATAEVRDPFGGDLEGYRETYEELDAMLGAIVARLERERLGDRR